VLPGASEIGFRNDGVINGRHDIYGIYAGRMSSMRRGPFNPNLPLPGQPPAFVGCVTKAITIPG